MKILFFIGSLSAGGKERRMIELLRYLKTHTDFSLLVVVRQDQVEYPLFNKLEIPYIKLTEKYRKGDKTLHFKFLKICKIYKPDIIHTWGSMSAFVSILAHLVLRIPHINSQITNAPPKIKKWSLRNLQNRINFSFSSVILANSYAGLKAYNAPSKKSKVIYNGVDLERFRNLVDCEEIKKTVGIKTRFSLIMVASFINSKNYNLFIDIARLVQLLRNDVSFIAAGDGYNFESIKQRVTNEGIPNIILTGRISFVEPLINCCDIGVLFSPLGEGISNSIIEYMALGKPVIASDIGGTKEIVISEVNGHLVTNESPSEIANLIVDLLNDDEKRKKLGDAGRKLINESFTAARMGREFENVYKTVIDH